MARSRPSWEIGQRRVYGDAPQALDVITDSSAYREPVAQPSDESADPDELPLAQLGRDEDGEPNPSRAATHLRAIVITAAVIVIVGFVIGVLVFNASTTHLGRGEATAGDAASRYLAAVNAGDETDAAAVACDTFANDARAAARTGSDAGISFALGPLRMSSKTAATVVVIERLMLPGGRVHNQPTSLNILRSGGRWLMCGRAG
jgi:hypothetical protein